MAETQEDPPPDDEESLPPPSTISPEDDDIDEDDEDKRKARRRKERESRVGGRGDVRTSVMSDGLDPKLVQMSGSLGSIDDTNEEEEDDDETTTSGQQQQDKNVVDYSNRDSVVINGQEYTFIQGKFEGDDYEQLMVKVENNIFFVKTPVDENVIIPFDLVIDTKARRDVDQDNVFYLNQQGQLITFEANNADIVNDLLSKFPIDSIVSEFEYAVDDTSTTSSSSVSTFSKKATKVLSDGTEEHKVQDQDRDHDQEKKLDQSFNDINIDDPDFNIDDYEIDDKGALVRKQKTTTLIVQDDDQRSSMIKSNAIGRTTLSPLKHQQSVVDGSPGSPIQQIKGYEKREVISQKMMKPRFSVRRIKQICNWLTSLNIWNKPITIVTLHSDLCNGVLLSRLAQKLVPTSKINFNSRALSEKSATKNLDMALGIFWRTKCVNNSRIASAQEIYDGNINRTVITLQEIFEVYVVQPLFTQATKMFRWFNNILKQYSYPIPEAVFTSGDLIDLFSYFQSGFAIFCIIHHLYGPITVGEGVDMIRIDAKRVVSRPTNVNEYRENIKYIFAILKALKISILYDLDDWLTYPDTEFIVYQLFVIYEAVKQRQCSLPPAQGGNAGVISGPNGEPMVTGMAFKDTLPNGQAAAVKKKPLGVFLGGGVDSIQLLPIDTSGDASHVYRMVCPRGLMSTKVKIIHANVNAKEEKSNVTRKSWNESVSTELLKTGKAEKKLQVLKQAHTPTPRRLFPKDESKEETATKKESESGLAKLLTPEELTEEMEKLERAMESSQQEMEELEEELAVKYLQLEQDASHLGDNEYNSRFSFLEKERVALEKERSKLQDFFAQQLKSLRERSASTSVTSPSKEKKNSDMSFYAATASGKKTSKVVTKKKLAERGWNQFVNNNESHNNVFKQKNQSVDSSFLSPTKHSTKNAIADKNISRHQVKKTIELGPKPVVKKTKDEIWESFKEKLRVANNKWMSKQSHRRGNRIQELMTPKAPLEMKPAVSYNSVPKIQLQKKLDEIVYEPGTPGFIRKRELELMKIEEARRWMVMQKEENDLLQEQNQEMEEPPPPPPPSTSPSRKLNYGLDKSPLPNSMPSPISKRYTPGPHTPYSSQQMPFFSPSPFALTPSYEIPTARKTTSDQDFEAMLSWLAYPRKMSLKDRNSKHIYQWVIEKENTKMGDMFALKWFRIDETKGALDSSLVKPSQEHLEGYVYCQEIISAQLRPHSSKQLIVELSSTPRSLKSSGGRTLLTIEFESETECIKYCDGLNELLPSFDQ